MDLEIESALTFLIFEFKGESAAYQEDRSSVFARLWLAEEVACV